MQKTNYVSTRSEDALQAYPRLKSLTSIRIYFLFFEFQSIDWDSIKWDELTPEQKWKLEHMRLHEKHRGHEKMHTEMILILFATLVISQVALVKWREIYPSSYHVSYNLNL